MSAKPKQGIPSIGEPQAKRNTRSRKGTRRQYIEIGLDAEQASYCKEIAQGAGFTSVSEGIRKIITEHRAGVPDVQRLKDELKQDAKFRAEITQLAVAEVMNQFVAFGLQNTLDNLSKLQDDNKSKQEASKKA